MVPMGCSTHLHGCANSHQDMSSELVMIWRPADVEPLLGAGWQSLVFFTDPLEKFRNGKGW